jgi:serine/threonine protein kinase
LADFGLARQLACTITQRQGNLTKEVYTVTYRPPEIVMEHTDYTDKADIWALGVTLVEYFIDKLLFEYQTEARLGYNILKKLIGHYDETQENLNKLKNNEIHDSVDVKKALKDNMSEYHYESIPIKTIDLLMSMLSVNTDDRPHISQLVSGTEICERTKHSDMMLKRGLIIKNSKINIKMYYILVDRLIDMSRQFKLKRKSIIACIDLLERYLANYSDVTGANLQLIGCTCLMISSKMVEIYPPEVGEYTYFSDNSFTEDQIKEMEIDIIKKFNYIVISCDIDDYVYYVIQMEQRYNQREISEKLKKLYKELESKRLYAGELSYNIILDNLKQLAPI